MRVSPAQRRDTWRQIANVLALVVTIIVNGLANALPLNGLITGEISDRFDVFFVPAAYVFSICGFIYLGLLGFAVFQAFPAQRANPRLRRVGYLFVLSCAANASWLVLWHYQQFGWTLVAMLVLLGSLIAIYARLRLGLEPVSTTESWLVRVPFSIYLGWITVATIANATTLLSYLGWNGWGISGEIWTMLLLAVGLALAAAIKMPYCLSRISGRSYRPTEQPPHPTVRVKAIASARRRRAALTPHGSSRHPFRCANQPMSASDRCA